MSSLRKGLLMRIAPRGKGTEDVKNEIKKRGNNGFSGSQGIMLRKLRKIHPIPKFNITDAILWETLRDYPTAYIRAPTGDNLNNCWKYINNGGGDKAFWYFYASGFPVPPPISEHVITDLEAFYFVIKLDNTNAFNKPWITIYTQSLLDGKDASPGFYRTRYNYSSFHDNGTLYPLQKGEYVFYIGDIQKIIPTFNRSTPKYNLQQDWGTPVEPIVNKHVNNLTPNLDRISAIVISTNSDADAGTFNFCLKEVGFKFKGDQQEVIRTVVR